MPRDLAVGGNSLCCLIIFVIFIGLGTAYSLGEILKLSCVCMCGGGGGGNPKRGGAIFMGEVDSPRHHVKILIWQL